MPVQVPSIDDEIAYILQFWIQNNVQAITGTIGQNVVWNLAQFIKQNPENYRKASVITDANINYTTQSRECIIIFTNNSAGSVDFGDNIWNKWVFVNQTNNTRTIAGGKFYYDLNGTARISIAPRKTVYIAKGDDDFWYEILNTSSTNNPVYPPLVFVVDRGEPNDPVSGTSIWQNDNLIGLGATNNNYIQIVLDGGIITNYGTNQNMYYDPVVGEIDLNFNGNQTQWNIGSGGSIDLNQ